MANSVTVSAIRDASRAITSSWTSEALGFLSILEANAAAELSVDVPTIWPSYPFTPYDTTLLNRVLSEPAPQSGSRFTTPTTDPGIVPTGTTIEAPELVQTPSYEVSSPAINLPTRPELATPMAPSAPEVAGISVPVAPTITLPAAPTLESVVFPDAPTLVLPTFAEAAPEAPSSFIQTTEFEFQDEAFDDSLLVDIRAKVSSDVANGGYGIEPTDEQALWARARDREMLQLDSVEAEVQERYTSRGYFLPPGGLEAAFNRARMEAENRLSETDREISVARANLFRDNRRFALEHGLTIEDTRLRHYGFKMERALNAQRFAAEYAIAVHDAYIRQFNAELQRYSTLAEVYRTRLQAALTQVQIYEAEVRAAVARQEASRLDVELYQALLQAANTRVGLYESQLRASNLQADIERLKIETYRSEVQAFTSQIEANQAQLGLYEAGIRGEIAKLDIFRTEVSAYSDRVRAAEVEQTTRNSRAQVQIATRQAELAEYQSKLERHRLAVATETSRVRALLERYSGDTAVYQAAISGYEALARVDLAEADAISKAENERTARLQANARLELEAAAKQLEVQFTAANAGAQITTGIINAVESTFKGMAIESVET